MASWRGGAASGSSHLHGAACEECAGRGSCGCHAKGPRTAGEQLRARAQHGPRGENGATVRHREAYPERLSRRDTAEFLLPGLTGCPPLLVMVSLLAYHAGPGIVWALKRIRETLTPDAMRVCARTCNMHTTGTHLPLWLATRVYEDQVVAKVGPHWPIDRSRLFFEDNLVKLLDHCNRKGKIFYSGRIIS